MNSLITILATLVAGTALAASPLPISTTEGQLGYASERLAAEAALRDINGPIEEAGGIVLEGDGLYYPTKAATSDQPEHFAIRLLFKGKLVAIYHTHPGRGGEDATKFSDNDKEVAAELKVNSYIKAVATGTMYVLKTNGGFLRLATTRAK